MRANLSKQLWLGRTSRRRFLRRSPPFFVACALTACHQPSTPSSLPGPDSTAQALSRPPTPACGDSALTPSQTAGPFYSPNSPQRQSLLDVDTVGTRLIVTGQVMTTSCQPLANSLIDVWQADAQGAYDNKGNKLRGHQFTDAEGRYWLETVVPGIYPGRTRHLHIKVQAPNRTVLTTQLYFPQVSLNARDFLFQPALLMAVQDSDEGQQAQFDFVLV